VATIPNITQDSLEALAIRTLLAQYHESPRLRALVRALTGVVHDQFVAPMNRVLRTHAVGELSGTALDWLGVRLGMPRPLVTTGGLWFGFKGTSSIGGRVFGVAPFWSRERELDAQEGLEDALYRRLIRARARFVIATPGRQDVEDCLAELFESAYVTSSAVGKAKFNVFTARDVLYTVVTSASGRVGRLVIPHTAGVAYTWNRLTDDPR